MSAVSARNAVEIRAALPRVIEHLAGDGLIAYPTETVYGFGGAITPGAVGRLRELKRRDETKPFLVLVSGAGQAPGVQWNATAQILADAFWPGPLTLALPALAGAFPDGVAGADGRVALRSSPHPFVRALTQQHGPLTSTSANAPGSAPASNAGDVEQALRELGFDDVLIIDGGQLPESPPSTIVAADATVVHVLREGAITRDRLEDQLAGSGINVVG
jgi:L-threonylcarbamoyladenylate synthase